MSTAPARPRPHLTTDTMPDPVSAFRRPLRVLVVDDNVDAADTLALLLAVWGYHPAVAYDGPAGLATAASFQPDAVLLDIGMPGMDGCEMARQLRQLPGLEQALLVAITGFGQEEDRLRSWQAGFDHHLVKPPDLGVLRSLLIRQADQVGV